MELLFAGGGIHQILCGLRAAMHVGQLELGVLELAQPSAELNALLRVLHGLINGAFGQTQSLRGDADTAAVQRLHGNLEALTLFAQQVLLRHDAVFKNQIAGGAAANAHLLLVLTHGEAGEGFFHDEGGDTMVAGLLIGHGEHHKGVGHGAVGDKALGAVKYIVVAIQHSHGLLAGGVGSGAGLGKAESADLLAGKQVGQILLLLLLGAVLKNGSAAQRGMSGDDDGGSSANLGQLLHAHGIGENVAAGAAILLGEINAHHAELCHFLHGFHGKTLFLVKLLCQRLYFSFGKFAVHLTEHQLLVRQMKIHISYSLY